MVKAAAPGREMTEIVRWSGRSPRTIRFWLDRFVAVGVSGLADAPRPGRPARADAAYLEALERTVETPPQELGFPFDVWTSPRLSAYRAETTAVRIAPGWLRALLARRDVVSGRPPPSNTCRMPPKLPRAKPNGRRRGKKGAAEPDRDERQYEDEPHGETNPYLSRVWHRRGRQPTVPAVGTNRRVTVFGSVEAFGRGRGEVLQATQDSAAFARYLQAREERHVATGKEVYLVLDNGPCPTSRVVRPPVDRQDDPRGPRTHVLAPPTAARTFQRLLSCQHLRAVVAAGLAVRALQLVVRDAEVVLRRGIVPVDLIFCLAAPGAAGHQPEAGPQRDESSGYQVRREYAPARRRPVNGGPAEMDAPGRHSPARDGFRSCSPHG